MATASSSGSSLDLIQAIKGYVDRIASDPSIGGMKVLLLDEVTTQVVAMVYSQTQVLEKEVYLVERLNASHERMPHLKAAVFIQPTLTNIETLTAELREPRFSEYHIFFSNVLPHEYLPMLAQADEHEVVRQVQEFYGDFMPINEDLFTLNITNPMIMSSLPGSTEAASILERNVQGILSMLLSIRRRPAQIRYSGSSDVARRLAEMVTRNIENDEIFEFRRNPMPLLLIMDRRDDPITPLLTQWTYQAMVHELLGLNNNRVSLKDAPGIKEDLQEVVLSCTQDEFFAQQRYANFGDLGVALKRMLNEYQALAKLNENINSIQAMQAFMERYPAFRSQSLNVSKHVALLSELSRLVDRYQLLDVSQLEQEISVSSDYGTHRREVFEKLSDGRMHLPDKLRLAILLSIRYESQGVAREVKQRLVNAGVSDEQATLIDAALDYAGESKRSPGLFAGSSIISKIGKSLAGGMSGVENVYTQHQPLLMTLLENIIKGKLPNQVFPSTVQSGSAMRFSEIIVFIVGGATYEEAAKVAEFNRTGGREITGGGPSVRVLLGGSCVQNSTSFVENLSRSFGPSAGARK